MHRSRFRVYLCYFTPFLIIAIGLAVLTTFASIWYLTDHFRSYSVDGLMRVLEISNADDIRPHLSMVSFSTRALPSLIIFAATSLVIFFLVYFIIAIAKFSTASWRICTANERFAATTAPKVPDELDIDESQQRQPPVNPNYPVLPEPDEYKNKF